MQYTRQRRSLQTLMHHKVRSPRLELTCASAACNMMARPQRQVCTRNDSDSAEKVGIRAWLTRLIHCVSKGLWAMRRSRSCVPDSAATSSFVAASCSGSASRNNSLSGSLLSSLLYTFVTFGSFLPCRVHKWKLPEHDLQLTSP